MNKRVMAKTMSAVTAFIMAASAMPIGVFAADSVQQAEGNSVYSVCSTDKVNGFEAFAYETTDEELDALLAQTQSYIKPTVKARSAYKGAYDFSMGGAQYPRSVVAEKGADYLEIYDKIDTAMSAFTNYGYESDVQPTKVNVAYSDGSIVEENHYYGVTVDVRDYKIPWTQENYQMMQQLMFTYLYANPQHYWNVNQVSVSGVSYSDGTAYVGSLNFPVYDRMIEGGTIGNGEESPRKAAKKAIESKIKEYQEIFAVIENMHADSSVSVDYSYEYVDETERKMCDEITYTSGDLSDPDAHTIVGSLVDGDCVCEGYAKAFSLLCNLAGVPTFMVTGDATNSSGNTEAHAWNLVQLNGSWYYMDATWNDGRNDHTYFLCGSGVMDSDHHFDNSETLVTSLPGNVSEENYKYDSDGKDENAPQIFREDDGTVYYIIEDAEDLLWFSEQVNSGKTINARLDGLIDMEGRDITPIGDNLGTQFRGIFDGQGNVICNFTVGAADNSPRYAGLFGIVGNGGVVKNLDVDQGTVNGGADISKEGTENCGAAGGIAGVVLSGATIENCTNGEVSVTCEKGAAGGIAGRIASGATVNGCVNGKND